MARTAPVPNMIAIPGMNPGVIVAGGGGGAGGGSGGSGKGKKKGKGKKGKKGGKKAQGGGKGEKGGKGCGDPVCPITGKMFLEVMDFAFSATKRFKFIRHYTSRRSDVTGSFGYGWTHPFGWKLEERRRVVLVYDDRGDRQEFERPVDQGTPSDHPFGWRLARLGDTYRLTCDDGETLTFERHLATDVFLLRYLSDVRGNTTTVEYDDRGRFIGITDSEGRPFRATLDDLGRIVRFQVPTEATHQNWMDLGHYRYDEFGDLVEYVDAVGFSWQYRYHNHLMIEHRTGCGLSYLYLYDGDDKDAYCVESWGEYIGRDDPALLVPTSEVLKNSDPLVPKPKGINYIKLTYIKDQFLSEVEDGLGGITRYFGDSYGRVVKEVDPTGAVMERFFDSDSGEVTAQRGTEAGGSRVISTDDGVPIGHLGPDGYGKIIYAPEPSIRVIEDLQTGATTTVHYNEYGEPISYQYADGTFELLEYSARGQIVSEVHRDGGVTRYRWDAMGNLVEVNGPSGATELGAYDYLGRCLVHVADSGLTTEFEYDGRSEVTRKILGNGFESFASYDANRHLTRLQVGQRVHTFEYGGLGWPVRHTFPDGRVEERRYDVEGNEVWVQNERGQTYTIERDVLGRVVRATDFEGILEERQYDSAGSLTTKTTALGIEALEYDEQGRLIGAEMGDQTVTLTYAPTGAIASVDNGVVPITCQYDVLGMLTRETQGSEALNVEWRGGFVHTIRTPAGVAVTLDQSAGVPSQLRVGNTSVRYAFPTPRHKVLFLGASLVRRDHYDEVGFLRWVTISRYDSRAGIPVPGLGLPGNPDQIILVEYDVNQYGEVIRERWSDGRSLEYEHDAAGRITHKLVRAGGQTLVDERIQYDGGGSPLLKDVGRDALSRPNRYANEQLSYDAAGRLVERQSDAGTTRFEWDSLDNLRLVVTPHHVVEMDYDARGRRMKKRVLVEGALTLSVRYHWDNQILLQEVNETTGWARTYLRHEGNWSPFGHVDTRGDEDYAYFYLGDATGLPDLVLDASGHTAWRNERTVYGDVEVAESSTIDLNVRFAGQLFDEHVGLIYNRMRWYDPRLGLYVSPDGKRLDAGLPLRDYVQNPTVFVDPMGEMAIAPQPSGNPSPTGSSYPKGWGDRPPPPTSHPDQFKGPYMVKPGHYAVDGTEDCPGSIICPPDEYNVPRAGKSDFSENTRRKIDAAGSKYGCHTCGSKNPRGPQEPQDPKKIAEQDAADKKAGKGKVHFVPDHIPPACLHSPRKSDQRMLQTNIPPGGVRLFPQCRVCSNRQKTDAKAQKDGLLKQGIPKAHADVQALFEKNRQSRPPWEPQD